MNERCRYDTWVRRTRLLSWMLGTLYEIGLVHGFGWHSGGGRMHICGHPFTGVRWGIPGKGPYLLWWPRQKWECLVKRHHWPYWPEGRPVFMGLCGKCARCSECGSIEQECYPWCSNVQPSEVGAMTPERLAEIERLAKSPNFRSVRYEAGIPLGPGRNLFDNETVADLIAHIRDLEAQVREAREALTAATKRSGQVINNWVTGGEDVCLVCGQIPNPDTHDEQCWVPLALAFLATATPPSPEVGA